MIHTPKLKRTLIGVGGVHLIEHPGVVYPKEVLRTRPGMERKTGSPYRKTPAWGISTREAAVILMCSPTAARQRLHRHKVLFHRVKRPNGPPALFWKLSQVEKLAGKSHPLVARRPSKLLDASQAAAMLGMARSALYRYAKKGTLTVTTLRVMTPKGARLRCFYRKNEILALARGMRLRLQRVLDGLPEL